MQITVAMAFDEDGALRLLNWLAGENTRIISRRPDLPLLYDSGIVYRREKREKWCDYINALAQGYEDCDGLSAIRAGELRARGWRALRRGEPGYGAAQELRPRHIAAEVMLTTRTKRGRRGLFHGITRYRIDGRWYRDDPSARLGMVGGRIHPLVLRRWRRAGVVPRG